jgi:ABC-type branched-subunit amino acid transport system permease subunit
VAILSLLVAFPLVASDYQTGLMTQFLAFGLLAMSLDLLGDRAGLISFGHGAWFGLGAYTLGLTLERLPGAGGTYLGFLLAALVGGGFAALLGSQLFLGRQRVGGVYFGIITLAVAAILQLVVMGWSDFTGGSNGLYGFATPELAPGLELAETRAPYVLTAIVCVLIYYGLKWVLGSALGLSLLAARQNPKRAESAGIPLGRSQLLVFTVAGAIAGIAGALYVPVGFVAPDLFGLTFSTYVIVWMVLGGRGTLLGGFVGAIGLSFLETALSGEFVTLWLLMVGALLIVVVLAWPRGALGALDSVTRALRS